MRLTIVAEDGVVGIGGTFYPVDMTGFPADVRAVQFYGTEGEIEFYDGRPNAVLDSIADFQVFIDRWQAAYTIATAPKPPPTQAELDAIEQTQTLATLREIDLASIRALREYVAAQPNAPQILKNKETEAQVARAKLKP